MKAAVLLCLVTLVAVASAGACSRVAGVLREADGTFCKECVLTKGFYRNNKGEFCIGACRAPAGNGAKEHHDSVTNEVCEPCVKDGKVFRAKKTGKFCKQECLRDGWYSNDKTESYRDSLTGQYCKPALHGTAAHKTLEQLKHKFQQVVTNPPTHATSAGLNNGACTLFGGYLRHNDGKFCAEECNLEDGYYRHKKTGEFCIRPCPNNQSLTGAKCEKCTQTVGKPNEFRTKDGRFCQQPCLRDGWLMPGVPMYRDPVTGRFCSPAKKF